MSDSILSAIDAEIARLQEARNMLAQSNGNKTPKKKHKISAEGRARIAAATRKRWRLQKQAAREQQR